ncbi:hypothetical protein TUN199_10830 [Pyrenophora tritici-repentis]|nr:hypothetical protein PtrV1_06465 [Pyrenophora tritici-repentis]KAI0571321.1 hypothetical protein Alg130_10927 [Pyrenophora tritici-repentis]KAI0604658.1 hypothetical protein TUN205_11097 [Pyrenophora tritici-repentis]KAI0617178.1 hypothetical protein TUN199_10830 [Pyrenophora tritici-repentis]
MPSLLDDPTTKYLWQQVQNVDSYENAAQSFWHHIYTKSVFVDKRYIVDYEVPPIPEEQGKRKVDQVVKEVNSNWGVAFVLIFHEIKRNEIPVAELEYVENQAFNACESYCHKYNIKQVYAQTSVGSRARFFKWTPGTWSPVDGQALGLFTAYMEFGDPAGETYILRWLQYFKDQGVTTPQITWEWDQTRQKHFYRTPANFIYQDGTMVKR